MRKNVTQTSSLNEILSWIINIINNWHPQARIEQHDAFVSFLLYKNILSNGQFPCTNACHRKKSEQLNKERKLNTSQRKGPALIVCST